MSRKSCLRVVLALCVIGLLAGSASAATIAIPNGSFESPGYADGGSSGSDGIAGWAINEFVGEAPNGWYGIYNPQDAAFTNTSAIQGVDRVPVGGDGTSIGAYLGNTASDTWAMQSQSLGALQAGTYTLTAAVGVEIPTAVGQADYALVIGTVQSGDLVRTPYAGSALPRGSFIDQSTSVVVPVESARLGEDLYVKLVGINTADYQEVDFDNVRLDFVAAPEPGTLALLASGLIGLVCYAWRKRK